MYPVKGAYMPGNEKGRGLPDQGDIYHFRERIMGFYRRNGRHNLLWRNTSDPYHILVSEIMLQQTQVSRVTEKYPLFISAFPDVVSLAGASLADVLGVWKGMGYNRRAIALREIAGLVVSRFSGFIPEDETVLSSFPGIGKATAGSIAAFAFNRPTVFIETNIRRVYIHCFFADQVPVSDNEIRPLVALTVDRERPREWYYALMDYGSELGRRITNPNRKSTHYYRQKAFEGSDRQLRGKVLKLLLQEHTLERNDLISRLGEAPERTGKILDALAFEGFIILENDTVRLHH
jgi:A/G-specific adenine glycosylase